MQQIEDKKDKVRRTETVNFRIRANMKEGLKLLFEGKKYSDSFEELIAAYLNGNIKDLQKQKEGTEKALKAYLESGDVVPSVKESMEHAINRFEREINRFKNIREVCFKDCNIEDNNSEYGKVFGYEN